MPQAGRRSGTARVTAGEKEFAATLRQSLGMFIPKPHPHGDLRPRGWLCNYSHGGCGGEGNKAISKLHVNKYAGGYSPV